MTESTTTHCNNNNEYEIRKQKALELIKNNINPWPNSDINKDEINQIKKNAKTLIDNNQLINIAGRIISIREHGKSIFITIKDTITTIQAYIKKNNENNADKEDIFNYTKKYLDMGDIITVSGTLFLTKTEEITVRIESILLLSKCLQFIPNDYSGLENIETRYRKRYLDILVNQETKTIFEKRAALIKNIRNILDNEGYLEVETPMLHLIPGGANAKPFITKHNALGIDLYLRIAPELYLKKMIVSGFNKVYEINKNFRNEGVSIRHNPEFTMLEFYTAYKNYHWAMDFVEEIIKKNCFYLNNSYHAKWNQYSINFQIPFDRLTPQQAIVKYTNITDNDLLEKNINSLIPEKERSLSYEEKVFFIFEEQAEKKLIHPTFIIEYPTSISPLAKADPNNSLVASRFELFICGMEISNGYNELNNPFDQKDRFLDQVKKKESGNDEAMYYDSTFIEALEYGMPPTTGVGIGIDRLCMLLTDSKSIKDVILFPTMKPC